MSRCVLSWRVAQAASTARLQPFKLAQKYWKEGGGEKAKTLNGRTKGKRFEFSYCDSRDRSGFEKNKIFFKLKKKILSNGSCKLKRRKESSDPMWFDNFLKKRLYIESPTSFTSLSWSIVQFRPNVLITKKIFCGM